MAEDRNSCSQKDVTLFSLEFPIANLVSYLFAFGGGTFAPSLLSSSLVVQCVTQSLCKVLQVGREISLVQKIKCLISIGHVCIPNV